MTQLTVYLHFIGNCAEAMKFYQSCLGGELSISTIGESPLAEQMPDAKDNVMHASLTSKELTIMGSDMFDAEKDEPKGNKVSLCISGTDRQAIETYFEKLSQGGNITHKLEETYFGLFGDLTDKFGIDWMFQVDKA